MYFLIFGIKSFMTARKVKKRGESLMRGVCKRWSESEESSIYKDKNTLFIILYCFYRGLGG
jgi:hypothetical protein